jgi:YggT family protein
VVIVGLLLQGLHIAAIVLFYVLWARVVLDFVRQLRRDWKPKGLFLAISVIILSITDPTLRAARRVVKPIRVGGAMLDLAMLVVMVLLLVVMVLLPSVYVPMLAGG